MLSWQIIITLLLVGHSFALTQFHTYRYVLTNSTVQQYFFNVQTPTRVTFIQQTGIANLTIHHQRKTIFSSSYPLEQFTLSERYVGTKVNLKIQGINALGRVEFSPVQQFELLGEGEQKWLQIKSNQFRVIEIHPRRHTKLIIQKISGIAQFTNNRCKSFEKIDCFNQLQRLAPITMSDPVQIVQIDYCSGCILLIKVQKVTSELRLRLYINASVTILQSIPTYSLLKQGQVAKFTAYGRPNFRGKLINFVGSVNLESTMKVDYFEKGFFYQFDSNHDFQTQVQLVVKGVQNTNFFSIQSVQNELQIRLKDGSPTTIRLQGGNNYTILFQHKQSGRGNFVISGEGQLMNRLSIHFINRENDKKYSVRPHYLFNTTTSSQNFQLDNSTGDIQVQLRLLKGFGGYLNVGATVKQALILPFDYIHSSILGYNDEDHYIIQGIPEQVELTIIKCVICQLQIKVQAEPGKWERIEIFQRQFKQNIVVKGGTLSIFAKTNNYAYYSLLITKKTKKQHSGAKIINTNVSVFLTEPDNQLKLQFQPPICFQKQCSNVKYYLVEGSDARHVASRAYCPNTLFDFDQRTKNIVFKQIEPLKVRQNLYSHTQPLVLNDWLVLAAEVENRILSYDMVNSGQIRTYKSLRWPIFYFATFVTLAAFLSFVIFMGLRRRKAESSNGYLRGSSSGEQLD